MKYKILFLILIASLMSFSGCVIKQHSVKPSQDILRLAEEIFDKEFIVISVAAFKNKIANRIVIWLSQIAGPSNMAKEAARLFHDMSRKSTSVLIFGTSDEVTKRVLFDALRLNKGKNIRGLQVLYIGNENGLGKIKELTEELGVTFYHRPKPKKYN